MFLDHFQSLKIKPVTWMEEKFPLIYMDNDGRTFTKGGQTARVIELTGKDYNGLDYQFIEGLLQGRQQFFNSLPTSITVLHQSHRQKLLRDINIQSYNNSIARKIANKWAENFNQTYRTRHFLVFVTAVDSIKDQFVLMSQKAEGDTNRQELIRILDDTVENAIGRLTSYGARSIKDDELASYWAWMLNGRHINVKKPENGFIENFFSGVTLFWPSGKKYQIYEGVSDEVFSAWLVIQSPATATSSGLFDNLFQLHHEFSIFQTFSKPGKDEALRHIKDKQNNNLAFLFNKEIQNELSEIYSRVQTDEISLIRHRFAIEIYENTPEKLNTTIRNIQNVIESWGYEVTREGINQEALFWSRFPELQNFNSRQKMLTSFNAAHFSTFASVGEGLESCSWGQSPVTLFKTTTGSDYSFIFHESTSKEALGNTIIIGGSGSGKTTTLSFLFSQCFKYPNFRVLAFDRLRGLEIFTKFHDGEYLDFHDGLNINPLQLEESNENKAFLNNWFQMLTGKHQQKDQDIIGKAIMQLFTLDKKQRTLNNIALAFGLSEQDSIGRALERWLPDGALGSFFNGQIDALDFNSQLVTFDMTTLLDVEEILAPMAYYIFHKLFLSSKNEGGYIVFVDELARYLKAKEFIPRVEEILQEIRKTDGIFCGAVQSLDKILDSPVTDTFKNNIATWICFSEPLADEKHYMDGLGFNEKEFEWIKQDHPRQVLVKRKSGESVILDINLKPLGEYLSVFDSGKKAMNKIKKLKQESPNDWKKKYIYSD